MIGIYKITSPSGKIYIGQSIDIQKRWKAHKKFTGKKQKKLYNSFLKYGVDTHSFEVICECNIEELNNKERYYQDLYSAIGRGGLNANLTKSDDRSGNVSANSNIVRALKKDRTALGFKWKYKIEQTNLLSQTT